MFCALLYDDFCDYKVEGLNLLKKITTMKDEIIKAIKERHQIKIKYLDLNFYVVVDPYIYGDDLFQESFVWGWIEHNGTCYKFYLDKIQDLKVSIKPFEIEYSSICYI